MLWHAYLPTPIETPLVTLFDFVVDNMKNVLDLNFFITRKFYYTIIK